MSIKQREFVKEFIKARGNGTQAALAVYDTDDPNVAHAIASENLQKPTIKRAIELALERVGLSDEYISELLREATVAGIGQKATNADSLRGIEMMLKLKDAFPAQKSAHVRVDYQAEYRAKLERMSMPELNEEVARIQKENEELIKDVAEIEKKPT